MALFTHPVVLLSLGGALGTNARYFLGSFVQTTCHSTFPFGTFVINVTGSFLLGVFAVLCHQRAEHPPHMHWYLLLGTGFCGGYTTFSAFALDTVELFHNNKIAWGILNIVGSVGFSLIACALAIKLTR